MEIVIAAPLGAIAYALLRKAPAATQAPGLGVRGGGGRYAN